MSTSDGAPWPGLLPARPPEQAGGRGRKPKVPAKGAKIRAICCSGGGIRAAAFSLGGMQRLNCRERVDVPSWYEQADWVTAVSGGSYMAASFAMVNHAGSDDPPPTDGSTPRRVVDDPRFASVPVYAPGSPEDTRLRAHTRYLTEDPAAAAAGILGIFYGLVLNLIPILAGIYVAAHMLAWLVIRPFGLLTLSPDATGAPKPGTPTSGLEHWHTQHPIPWLWATIIIASVGLVAFGLDRLIDVYLSLSERRSRWLRNTCFTLLSVAGVVAALCVGVPALLEAVTHLGITGILTVDPAQGIGGLIASVAAIVALVRGTLGKLRIGIQTAGGSSPGGAVSGFVSKVLRALLPWTGSVIAAALLVLAFLLWVSRAVLHGSSTGGWLLVGLAAVIIVVWKAVTDVNRNSIHPFYKQRLSTAFAVERSDDDSARPRPYANPIRFSTFRDDPGPKLVVCAAVNTDQPGVVPSGRGCAPFTFSARWSGISAGTMFDGEHDRPPDRGRRFMVPTERFEESAGMRLMTLPAAVAVSGAAVSPIMGRMTRAPLRLLLGLANVRLGLWLPNPLDRKAARRRHPPAPPDGRPSLRWIGDRIRWQISQPGIFALFREMVWGTGLGGRWIYVTDGGHYENLGLVEALRRGATEIVVFDASGDRANTWTTFGEAIETARADLGIEIDLNPSAEFQATTADGFARTLAARGGFTRPDGTTGVIYLCKLAVPDEATWDVYAWAATHPSFPHDSTAQQLYGDREFEAYRKLGEIAADMAVHLMVSTPSRRPRTAAATRHPAEAATGSADGFSE